MLDYTVDRYVVEFLRKGDAGHSSVCFCEEEQAVQYIKDSRRRWVEYRLIKISNAVIDF